MRDWAGKVLKVGAANYGLSSCLVTEGRALKDGFLLAVQAGYMELIIEGDNLVVIQALQGKIPVPWKIANIITDIHGCFLQGSWITINHIYREANMAADWLSKFGHSIIDNFTIDFYFFPSLRQMIADDCIGLTLVRRGD